MSSLQKEIFLKIMSKIFSADDVGPVLQNYLEFGLITMEEEGNLRKVIFQIIENEQLKSYFATGKKVFTERELLTSEKEILIPDRLFFNGNGVTIIDYKTGKKDKKHEVQIQKYADCLHKIGYEVQDQILVYVQNELEIIQI